MKTTIEKALEANLTAGNEERITIDGVEFSRLPLTEPVLWIPYADIMQRVRTLEEVTTVATLAHAMIARSGLSWEDYRKLPLVGPEYRAEVSIWKHYNASLELFSTEFLHEDKDITGLWYYDFNNDFVVVMPKESSHLLVAKYYPSAEEYQFLKSTGFKHKSSYTANHPDKRYAYFLNVEEYDAATLKGIITV